MGAGRIPCPVRLPDVVPSPTPPPPLPLADLTPDHLRGVTPVHASDPARPGFHVWVPVPGLGRAGGVLEVALDSVGGADPVAALRVLIAVVADRRRPPDPS
ncbi:hypothetical protein J0H58_04970 [bacterium]|nr:hypothetical protein [bacterium]